jgi:ArsR family transcriptional regulator
MDDLDILLSIIENPTRRRILEALVREPHYPLQLSRQLGLSQQGIMKHLKVLEDNDLVRSYSEDSDQGGPARKIYVPTTGFTITMDIGPGLFSAEFVTRTLEGNDGPEEPELLSEEDRRAFKDRVDQGRQRITEIDRDAPEPSTRTADPFEGECAERGL